MNYNAIDIDEEVAFVDYRNRGAPYPMFARKGLVLDKRKIKKWHNKSMTGQVQVEVALRVPSRHNPLDVTDDEDKQVLWVDAYNVIDFWDRFEQERDHLYRDILAGLNKDFIERKDREAARLEEMERKKQRALNLAQKVEVGLSLPKGSVTVTDYAVTINRDVLETRFLEKIVES